MVLEFGGDVLILALSRETAAQNFWSHIIILNKRKLIVMYNGMKRVIGRVLNYVESKLSLGACGGGMDVPRDSGLSNYRRVGSTDGSTMAQSGRAIALVMAIVLVLICVWSSLAYAQAGISILPGQRPTGTIGSNKGAVQAVQCPVGTVLSGVKHVDIAMNSFVAARGMTGQLSLYCSRISTDGHVVETEQITPAGTPAVEGFRYPTVDDGTTQHAYCPAGQVAHQFGGWDRNVNNTWPWASAVRLVCRPLELSNGHWLQIDTSSSPTYADAGNQESNGVHILRGPFCDENNPDTMVSGYHRQAGGVGYDGINVYCGSLQQARFSAVMTFTDFAWDQTLGVGGWLVNLNRNNELLDDGGSNNGASRVPYASLDENTASFQSDQEIYVVPNSGYGAQIGQRPSGIDASSYVVSGNCVDGGISLSNKQDNSCMLDVHGLPDIGVSIATSDVAYVAYGQTKNVTVTATNYGPGSVEASDGFTLVTVLPAGWTATSVPGCIVNEQQVVCDIADLNAAASPGESGGSASFTFPVTVNAPTSAGTYSVNVALGRALPDGDADPTNDDYNRSNDNASGDLILSLNVDLAVNKVVTPEDANVGDLVRYTLTVTNSGPETAINPILQDQLPVTGLDCLSPAQTPACSAAGGAVCPSEGVDVASLTGAGVVLPLIPAAGSVTITLECVVTSVGTP